MSDPAATKTKRIAKKKVDGEPAVVKSHSCYILYNERDLTYVGYTVNFTKRIRQHNKEIKGGARYTSSRGPWKYLVNIESEHFDNHKALSAEWALKYPTNKRPAPRRFRTPIGRVTAIPLVLSNPKFAGIPITIKVIPEHYTLLKKLCAPFPHVRVLQLEEIQIGEEKEKDNSNHKDNSTDIPKPT